MPRGLPSTAGAFPRGGKDFQCGFCQRPFARLEHRKRHERIHTKEKPYRCLQCPRSFARSDLLVRHQGFSHGNGDGDGDGSGNSREIADRSPNGLRRVQNTRQKRVEAPQLELEEGGATACVDGEDKTQQPATQQCPSQLNLSHPFASNLVDGLSSTVVNTDPSRSQRTWQDYDLSMGNISMGVTDANMNTSNMFDNIPSVFGEFGSFNMPLWYFPTNFDTDPLLPYFSPPQTLDDPGLFHGINNAGDATEHSSGLDEDPKGLSPLSQFESRFTSLQPKSGPTIANGTLQKPHALWNVTAGDYQQLLAKMESFNAVIPAGFVLPSRHTLSRYLAGYASGFHGHLPFLHISTLEVHHALPELVVAIAAVGGLYCFEDIKSAELFMVSKAIALERLRRRQGLNNSSLSEKQAEQAPSGLRPRSLATRVVNHISPGNTTRQADVSAAAYCSNGDSNRTESSQTLILLLAMATWSGKKAMYGEALSIQSTLATIIREYGLLNSQCTATDTSWEDWIRSEGEKRTYFTIYCLFNFHSILYNTAPAILNIELGIELPCSENEWNAPTEAAWKEIHRVSTIKAGFQQCFLSLFTENENKSPLWQCSSFGGYALIHALIQQIFLTRQVTRCRPGADGSLTSQEVSTLEQALTNWQRGWEKNPESSLDPKNPHGPLAFTSTALLRIAYIRLHLDVGPFRALETRDPERIAQAMLHSPVVKRSQHLTQSALHSAHALSIPIRLGVNLISRNQIITWSLQHSVCSLECVFLLSKWLDAVAEQSSNDQPLNEDEERLLDFVVTMLRESDSNRPSIVGVEEGIEGGVPASCSRLSARVVKVWAKIFCGERIWGVVDLIGRAMHSYGDLLEGGTP